MPDQRETRFYYSPDITRYQQKFKEKKEKTLIDLVFITQTKKKNGHVEIQPELKRNIYIYVGDMTHFLYSMLCLVSFVCFLYQQEVIPRYLRPRMQNFRRMYKK